MSREPESRWTVPRNWVWTTLSELGDIVAGGTPSTKEPIYWTDEVNWISPADLTGYSAKTIRKGTKSISRSGLANSSAKVMPAGSVHFSTRAPIGYVVISSEPLATNQGFKSLVPAPSIFNEYVYYYLMASRDYARKRASGTTFLELSGRAFGDLPIPLAPTATQHKIVAKIEELFSELDKGVESLKTARAKLNVYRQAVLKHAFEGKLTAQWRQENKDKLEKPEQFLARVKQERAERYEKQLKEWNTDVNVWEATGKSGKKPAEPKKPPELADVPDAWKDKLPQLPENWGWVRVGDFCEVVRGGSPRPAGDSRYYDGTIPFLKVADLTRTAGVYLDTHSFSIKEAGLHKTRLVEPPILMLSNSGATLGVPKVCRIRTTFNDGIAAFLGLDENDLLYHYYFWASKTLELRAINQGAAQPNLNTNLIEETFIPLCSKKEMQTVAREIERSLSMCDQLAADIDTQLMKSVALRQSILKKAFAGQLVPQDPHDEPASVLIDRIRAAREQAVKNNHAKKTKKKKPIA